MPEKEKPTREKIGCAPFLLVPLFLFSIAWVWGITREDAPKDTNAPQQQEVSKQNGKDSSENLDDSSEAITSCAHSDMQRIGRGFSLLSEIDKEKICQTVLNRLQNPSIGIARSFFKAVIAFDYSGHQESAPELAYQLMNLIEARGASTRESIHGTLDVAYKIYQGSQGHVTPKDLNIMLRSSGPVAHTLSDEGLMSMAALLWEEKKNRGE